MHRKNWLTVNKFLNDTKAAAFVKTDAHLCTLIDENASFIANLRRQKALPSTSTMYQLSIISGQDPRHAMLHALLWCAEKDKDQALIAVIKKWIIDYEGNQ